MDPGDSFGKETVIKIIVHKMHIQLEGGDARLTPTLNNTFM